MPSLNFFDDLRALVARGSTEEALGPLLNFFKGAALRDLASEVLLLQNQFARLRRDRMEADTALQREEVVATEKRCSRKALYLIDEGERAAERRWEIPVSVRVEIPAENLEVLTGKTSTLKPMAWLRKAQEAARSVCRVKAGRNLGTGFLLGDGRLVTNEHVFNGVVSAAGDAEYWAEFDYEEEVDGALRKSFRYPLRTASARVSAALDICVVALDAVPGHPALNSWGGLELAAGAPEAGENVTIIQHPGGGPKQIALTNNQVVERAGPYLRYTTDTLAGSSGSPVFNDAWRVVAVHHAGGGVLTDSPGMKRIINQGIAAARAAEFLAGA